MAKIFYDQVADSAFKLKDDTESGFGGVLAGFQKELQIATEALDTATVPGLEVI